ncbi:DMT family transporter [Pseudorhodobacter sp. MZDSW-24AT]|uniref:DMT family transporter n=1 Tax=Pseudorhodobacter sp. MZDSW-24AT TaxID=2052957 RepID=UPI001E4D1FD4|nr:DMT family transporter [Pseudorhodobacter sp. MZDSW-24AT]
MSEHRLFALVLMALGLGWGMTQPLGKLATSTGHQPFGLIFWQLVICTGVLGALSLLRGKGLVFTRRALGFALVVAVLGTLVPNATFYTSIQHLPSGIMSILISAVPLLSFPMALALGMDRFSKRRILGLGLGLMGVALIAAPGAGLPGHLLAFLPLALVGPLFYAMEANYVARHGTGGMDAVQAMFMASLVGMILCLPVAVASGQWIDPRAPWGLPEAALIASSVVHALCYAGYVWLAARAGAVFAAQCSYLVTGAGVVWAMLLLGERLQPLVWAALVVMLAGVALVQPRQAAQGLQGE